MDMVKMGHFLAELRKEQKLTQAELGEKLTVVATGGLGRAVISHCKHEIIYDEDLIIKGLIIIYYRNVGK